MARGRQATVRPDHIQRSGQRRNHFPISISLVTSSGIHLCQEMPMRKKGAALRDALEESAHPDLAPPPPTAVPSPRLRRREEWNGRRCYPRRPRMSVNRVNFLSGQILSAAPRRSQSRRSRRPPFFYPVGSGWRGGWRGPSSLSTDSG
jgi:hypothetical protein